MQNTKKKLILKDMKKKLLLKLIIYQKKNKSNHN